MAARSNVIFDDMRNRFSTFPESFVPGRRKPGQQVRSSDPPTLKKFGMQQWLLLLRDQTETSEYHKPISTYRTYISDFGLFMMT